MKDDKVILTWKGTHKKIATCSEDCQLIRTKWITFKMAIVGHTHVPSFISKSIWEYILITHASRETCSLAQGKNFSRVWKSCMELESQGKRPCAKSYRIAHVLVPSACHHHTGLFFCAAGLFSHLDKTQRPAVLKVTKLWLFVSVGELVLQQVKTLSVFFANPREEE